MTIQHLMVLAILKGFSSEPIRGRTNAYVSLERILQVQEPSALQKRWFCQAVDQQHHLML